VLDKVVSQLKKGTVKNVVPYGSTLPAAPYLVVKEEPEPARNLTRYRVIYHALPGQVLPMRDYVRRDLVVLLDGKKLTGSRGNVNVIESMQDIGPVVAHNDDGTISQDRVFQIWDLF